ncbi:MAG: glycosyltransferase family A protein [Parachlamydiaceae bacterium]
MAEWSISVIIPYFNAGQFIEEALKSIRRQNYPFLEIILIDDGSSDNIGERVKTLGKDIIFLRQNNKGPAAARNFGIKQAKGDIIAFLDADDEWPDDKLALQLARLRSDSSLKIVTGRIKYIRLKGAKNMPIHHGEENGLLNVNLGALLVHKEVFDKVGLFDESLRFAEDLDWFFRVRESGIKIAIMKEINLLYQQHSSNMTRENNHYDLTFFSALKRSINRRQLMNQGKALNLVPLSEFDDAK